MDKKTCGDCEEFNYCVQRRGINNPNTPAVMRCFQEKQSMTVSEIVKIPVLFTVIYTDSFNTLQICPCYSEEKLLEVLTKVNKNDLDFVVIKGDPELVDVSTETVLKFE